MVDVYRRITYYAPSDVTVLVHGETGTGKELVAQSIYRRSRRSGGPFIAVNLGSVAPTLAESELFGHVKGAFTGAHRDRRGYFEMADRGTIFLDEIGEASAVLQVKLLRVIQEGVFWPVGGDSERNTDIRIIAATNRDLRRMVGRGEFREDLYYRLAVAMIFVPPLRDRLDDLDVLTSHLLRRLARKHSVKVPVIADDAREGMRMHCWPGNVRELESCLERGLLRARGGVIRWEDLEVDISHDVIHRESPNEATTDNRRSAGSPLAHGLNATGSSNSNLLTLQALQRDHIRKALRRSGGNLTQAARLLGIPRTTLQSRLKALGIERSGQLR